MTSCTLITTSWYSSEEAILKSKKNMKAVGFNKIEYKSSGRKYFSKWAGKPEHRKTQFQDAFRSDSDCVICIRGGSGIIHFLTKLDWKIIKKHPKFLIGFSDMTPLLNHLYEQTGIITLHGPNAFRKQDAKTIRGLKTALKGKPFEIRFKQSVSYSSINSVSGIVKGGNLARVAESLGAPYEIDMKGKIAFFEDVHTNEFRAFNRLVQLKNSGKFLPKAIVFGNVETLNITKFIKMVKTLFPNIPLVYGIPFGHKLSNLTIPIGAKCKIDFEKKILKFTYPDSVKDYAMNLS